MNEPDHEKNALVNMIQEAMGREIHLRAALSRAQLDLAKARVEIERLTPGPEQPEPALSGSPGASAPT
jgi:hypothetical protein